METTLAASALIAKDEPQNSKPKKLKLAYATASSSIASTATDPTEVMRLVTQPGVIWPDEEIKMLKQLLEKATMIVPEGLKIARDNSGNPS